LLFVLLDIWDLTNATVPEVTEVPELTKTPPPSIAVFPLMVHDEMATVPPSTKTPPPHTGLPKKEMGEILNAAVLPEIEED
jgi:hypothetical protein